VPAGRLRRALALSHWEHAGLPFGWHARQSLAAELDRDAAELRATTVACFDHYTEMFSEPYPFDSYDQAFVPGLNWGAQEMPGCVTYADELLPRMRITDNDRRTRATIIAHEMAHMWFGDLVTMRWWEDTWLNESFADYMGYRVGEDAAGFTGSLLGHEAGRKPGAYDADQRRSTHPVAPLAEGVPDVDAAFTNFDAISYAKGNSVLRQLVTWLGDEDFLAGVNAHLTRHRFGNASLEDLVSALDDVSERDVSAWAEVWLRRSGFDTLRVTRDGDVPVLTRDGSRPHRLQVTAHDAGLVEVGSRWVELGADPVTFPDWAGRVVVPNAQGETFARVELDEHSWAAVTAGLSTIENDLTRAVLWTSAFDRVRNRDLTAAAYLDLVARHVPGETQVALLEGILSRTVRAVIPWRVDPGHAAAGADAVAAACAAVLDNDPDEQRAIACSRWWAMTTHDAEQLRSWLAGGRTHHGLELDPEVRWIAIHRLAEIGAADAAYIEAERRRDETTGGELGALRALAARPTAAAKSAAWESMADDEQVSNRSFAALAQGLWSAEQAELLAPYVTAYFRRAPMIAERRGQAFSQAVGTAFPRLRLTGAQVDELTVALAGELPLVLRRKWEDYLDDLL
jgi:aminopeptidase N